MKNNERIKALIEYIIAHLSDLDRSYFSFIYNNKEVVCTLDSIYNKMDSLKIIMRTKYDELITLDNKYFPEIKSLKDNFVI